MSKADVCVIGLGYIGLPTAVVLADNGVRVHGVDVNSATVEAVANGLVPFVEPDLGEYVERVVGTGALSVSTTPVPAATYIVAVPTPFLDDHTADLSYIVAATRAAAAHLEGSELLILESTSPPGATLHMAETVLRVRPDLAGADLKFAHCPERVLPGSVMSELVRNDRIVGGLTQEAAEAARSLYRVFCEGEILLTDAKTAEMAKLVENSFRDVNIAFANELSLICDDLGLDVWELIELANHHPRVSILNPGPGVGGHCIAVDPWFIVSAAPERARLIRTAREVNDGKPRWVAEKIELATAGLESPVVAMLGLSFKPNIDDLRESPALAIVRDYAVENPGAQVLAVEPYIKSCPLVLSNLNNVRLVTVDAALEAADVVVVLVDHDEFRTVAKPATKSAAVIDTRGLWR